MNKLIKQLKFNRQQRRFLIKLKNELSKYSIYSLNENYYYWIKTFLNNAPVLKSKYRKNLAICIAKNSSEKHFTNKFLNAKHYYNKYILKKVE